MNTENFDIDIVYLWVDGNDPIWRAKRDAFIGKTSEDSSRNCEGRYADNDELKYSLRSIEKYAPWIRNIYIVTDNQQPSWLDISCPKVKIIDLTEIMPREVLPCFNSSLIEKFLHNIPGLAEHFLYSNDDMFLYKTVKPSDFFMPDGYPIIRLKSKRFRRLRWYLDKKLLKKTPSTYRVTINMASKLVNKKYGVYYSGIPHHNIDAYLKAIASVSLKRSCAKNSAPTGKTRCAAMTISSVSCIHTSPWQKSMDIVSMSQQRIRL